MQSFNTRITVDSGKCPQNHPCPCIGACPVGAISQDGYSAPEINDEKCVRCGKCAHICPKGAMELKNTRR